MLLLVICLWGSKPWCPSENPVWAKKTTIGWPSLPTTVLLSQWPPTFFSAHLSTSNQKNIQKFQTCLYVCSSFSWCLFFFVGSIVCCFVVYCFVAPHTLKPQEHLEKVYRQLDDFEAAEGDEVKRFRGPRCPGCLLFFGFPCFSGQVFSFSFCV